MLSAAARTLIEWTCRGDISAGLIKTGRAVVTSRQAELLESTWVERHAQRRYTRECGGRTTIMCRGTRHERTTGRAVAGAHSSGMQSSGRSAFVRHPVFRHTCRCIHALRSRASDIWCRGTCADACASVAYAAQQLQRQSWGPQTCRRCLADQVPGFGAGSVYVVCARASNLYNFPCQIHLRLRLKVS